MKKSTKQRYTICLGPKQKIELEKTLNLVRWSTSGDYVCYSIVANVFKKLGIKQK